VQESVVESLPAKRALLARLDAMTSPEVILASSTSAFATSMLAADIPGHGRCVVVHPVNPPHLIPFVELSGAPFTALDVLDRAEALMRDVGQSPIRLKREIHGFVLNRLQWTLLAEAYRLVADGIVDAEAIDRAIRDGLARRWAFMGPFEVGDLNAPEGLADYFARFGDAIEAIDVSRRETPLRLDPQVISTLHAEQRGRWPDQDPHERAVRVQDRDAKLLELAVWRAKTPAR
jgi:3-hydroxyacyl-CoA dehydrogenase